MPFFKIIISFCLLIFSQSLNALPIGFGKNQIDAKYQETSSENFRIFHDSRTPNEAKMIRDSLEAAKPVMEHWMQIKRERPLGIITSAISHNASFANFITDVLEVQSYGSGHRDLFWHEYVHENMYLYLSNWFGPAGSTFHLATLPLWFIEGLADTLSFDDGSATAYSVERSFALSGVWPSYDRLHNPYDPNFSLRAYNISATFVSWILRTYGAEKLPQLMQDFKDYSMPWYWPWAAVPFNNFLPLDAALENMTGLRGAQLWEKYKKEATKYHKQAAAEKQSLFKDHKDVYKNAEDKSYNSHNYGIIAEGDSFYRLYLNESDDNLVLYKIVPDFKKASIKKSDKQDFSIPPKRGSTIYVKNESNFHYIGTDIAVKSGIQTDSIIKYDYKSKKSKVVLNSKGNVTFIGQNKDKLFWLEAIHEQTRLCYKKQTSKKHQCLAKETLPKRLTFIGEKKEKINEKHYDTKEVWLRLTTQKLTGDNHDLLIWNLDTNRITKHGFPYGRPIKAGFSRNRQYVLTEQSYENSIIALNPASQCQFKIQTQEHITNLEASTSGLVYMSILGPVSVYDMIVKEDALEKSECGQTEGHKSPLLYAMQQKTIPDLAEALAHSTPWQQQGHINVATSKNDPYLSSGKTPHGQVKPVLTDRPYDWNARPIFLFPYIGANDPISTQFGAVSIPIMDFLQNETLTASFLYGLDSHFPNSELTFTSTRYWPTLEISAYRQQSWNGSFTSSVDRLKHSVYLDEKGARTSASFKFHFYKTTFTLGLGSRFSQLKRYLGPFRVREGRLNEPEASISMFKRWFDVSLSTTLKSRFTSEEFNKHFDYNQVSFFSTLSWYTGILSSTLSTGFDVSRTRGKKTRLLQEVYTPLKTFIPGSGGGNNQAAFTFVGSGLFSQIYGNNQARGKANLTIPINDDLDKLIGIAYFDRLDFTAFYNRGGAWYGELGEPNLKKIVSAHGYNLDLQFKAQSINFNAGIGIGQVIGLDYQLHGKFGFDALF